MPLISSTTIITSISLFHLTLAFFFLTNPRAIDDQALVYVMGESMGMVSHCRHPWRGAVLRAATMLTAYARAPPA